jgi:predicted deacylase
MTASLRPIGLRAARTAAHAVACTMLLSATAMAQNSDRAALTVGTATAQPGTLATGVIAVPAGSDSALNIPVAVIDGVRPGPVVTFVAGSHGTEYASTVALQQFISRVDPKRLAGAVIVVPLINIPSFETMTPHLNPVDHKSMAGGMADPAGTQSQRTLALLESQVITPADVVVDLHGGDLDENLRPYSYWTRSGKASQDSASLQLVKAWGMDHVIVGNMNPDAPNAGRSLGGFAMVHGKTVLVAESGRTGTVTPADLTALTNGSLNVLGALKMIDHPGVPVSHFIWLEGPGKTITADSAGMFFASVDRDTKVTAGQLIGYTTDFLGKKTGELKAPIDGLVTYIRGVPSMWPHAVLYGVLPIMSGSPPPWQAPPPPPAR